MFFECIALVNKLYNTSISMKNEQFINIQLGLPEKGHAIKGMVVCNSWDLEPLDLLNGLALGCYQPYPKVLIEV